MMETTGSTNFNWSPYHTEYINLLFDKEVAKNGIDLWGVVEVKETAGKAFKVKMKDLVAVEILFFHRVEKTFTFVNIGKIAKRMVDTKKERSFTWKQVEQLSSFQTDDPLEAYDHVQKLRRKYGGFDNGD